MSKGFAAVQVVGNLTRDPELRMTGSGTYVCEFGVAVNKSRKVNGEWQDVAHFFDVVVWGKQGETCAQYLAKGRQVSIDGSLEQQRWEAQDGGKRSKVIVVANQVVFHGGAKDDFAF